MDLEVILSDIKGSLSRKAIEQFEIYFLNSRSLSIEIKEQQIDFYQFAEENALALRVLKNQKIGFSYTTQLNKGSVEKVIEDALNGLSSSTPDPFYGFPVPSIKAELGIVIFDEQLPKISHEEKIEKARFLEKATKSFDQKIKKIRRCSYNENIIDVSIVNSEGVNSSQQKSLVNASVLAVAEDGKDSQSGWDYDFSYFFEKLNVESIARGAAIKALEMLGARRIKSIKCPVVLDNFSSAQFLEALAYSFLSESVQKQKSLLKGKIGERVFSSALEIIDDGLYPGGAATASFDGEGVPHQRTILVSDGVLKGFLYDTYYARREQVVSTGNSCRGGFRQPPGVGVTNFFIKEGEVSFDHLLTALDKGVLVTEVMGIHTVDPVSGDFSVGIGGFWVEGGKKSFPLKGMALSGNLIELFNKVKMVGNDLRFFGNVGAPSLLLEAMDVSGE